jgi:hypothetical protein
MNNLKQIECIRATVANFYADANIFSVFVSAGKTFN